MAVVLVLNFANEFFEQIFHRYQPIGAAELINHDSDMAATDAHFHEQINNAHTGWNKENIAQYVGNFELLALRKAREAMVSVVSPWEVAINAAGGKLRLMEPPVQWFVGLAERYELREVPLDATIACAAAALPPFHRDPFDRILVCQALEHGLTIVTVDAITRARVAGQSGLLTRAQARAAGLTERAIDWRLSSGRWVAVHPGVYLTSPGRDDWEMRAVAALLHAGSGAVLVRRAGLVSDVDAGEDPPVELRLAGVDTGGEDRDEHSRAVGDRGHRVGLQRCPRPRDTGLVAARLGAVLPGNSGRRAGDLDCQQGGNG